MKSNATRLARFGALLPVAVAALAAAARGPQPFDTSAWAISAAESRVEPYRGRTALLLREGAAWMKGSRFQNGTIEFDIAFSDVSGFPGIAFRAATRRARRSRTYSGLGGYFFSIFATAFVKFF